jgi:hypothetical protein
MMMMIPIRSKGSSTTSIMTKASGERKGNVGIVMEAMQNLNLLWKRLELCLIDHVRENSKMRMKESRSGVTIAT